MEVGEHIWLKSMEDSLDLGLTGDFTSVICFYKNSTQRTFINTLSFSRKYQRLR